MWIGRLSMVVLIHVSLSRGVLGLRSRSAEGYRYNNLISVPDHSENIPWAWLAWEASMGHIALSTEIGSSLVPL